LASFGLLVGVKAFFFFFDAYYYNGPKRNFLFFVSELFVVLEGKAFFLLYCLYF
jgi:hypothetical protein